MVNNFIVYCRLSREGLENYKITTQETPMKFHTHAKIIEKLKGYNRFCVGYESAFT